MKITKVPFQEVPQFSSRDIAYATADPRLRPFYKYEVKLDNFRQVMEDKKKDAINREVLVEVLRDQYKQLETTDTVLQNIESLRHDNTFTIITAHQPSLFTGPLYYIFKIISIIRLAEEINLAFPESHIVPVFISGSEDHDFEEINHAHLFGKSVVWENESVGGAVGFMKTSTLDKALEELQQILGDSENAQLTFELIKEAYTSHALYGQAAQHLVNRLFKHYGLVVINMNEARLKRLFIPYMEKELFEQLSNPLVNATQDALEAVGFPPQAHARDINLFYLGDQLRARIETDEDGFRVVDTNIRFTTEAIREELHQHPERFSPNVVMRPVFQEVVLPNLAYIGGGGELAYWLERKSQFEAFGINYPMLIRRNSALWIDRGACKRMQKLELSVEDLLQDTEHLLKRFVRSNTDNEISLTEEKAQLEATLLKIAQKAEEVDPSLKGKVLAENAKVIKSVENLESRLMRAEKQRYETALNQIRSLKDKLFPNNGLQERYDNFIPYYLRYGDDFFAILKEHLHPLEEGLLVFMDE